MNDDTRKLQVLSAQMLAAVRLLASANARNAVHQAIMIIDRAAQEASHG